jgi:hypothetical protein
VKNEHRILSLIVAGRRQGERIVVYLQPLINKFKKLWEGIHVYDVSIPIPMEMSFTLYGICAHTMQDYPGLGVFFGKYVHRFVYIYNFVWHTSFGATIFLTLKCYVYDNIIGLVTKGYHGCKCCIPSIKARWSNHLRKLMYDCLKVFLQEDHPYRRVASTFNGKPERTQRLEIMTPIDWNRHMIQRRRRIWNNCLIQMGNLCSMILNFLTPMLRKFSLG